MSYLKYTILICICFLIQNCTLNSEIHVSKSGSDSNSGTEASPLFTISKAAEMVKSGQTIWIHSGTYREYVNPPIGGTTEEERIIFKAIEGDEVFIKGSEEINSWTTFSESVWKVELDTAFFNGYNPYSLNVSGDFQNYGQWHHRGDVYLNNSAFYEQVSLDEVLEKPYSWFTKTENGITSIYANFDEVNPNDELVEINVRELIFFATDTDVNYLTLDGLRFLHAAPNWQAPNTGDNDENRLLQVGAVGTNMGRGWIIENSEIAHSKTAGLMLGENEGPEVSFEDISQFGDHIIRNNYIHKNGQYGIAGQKGISRSAIISNRIEDINYRNEFGGYEPAGIKIWNSSDVLIENNFIHRVIANQSSLSQAYCVWIDFANQGTRITRNILIGSENTTTALFLEANVGPTLVDNNIIVDKENGGIMVYSGGSIFAHNLFINSNFDYKIQQFGNEGSGARRAYTLKPNSTLRTNMGTPVEIVHNQMVNNIFAGANGPSNFGPSSGEGNIVESNVYMDGAKPIYQHLGIRTSDAELSYSSLITEQAIKLNFQMDSSFLDFPTRLVDADYVGIIPLAEQSIMDENGIPITVDWDFNKQQRATTNPIVGPLSNLREGTNSVIHSINIEPTPALIYYPPIISRGN